MTASDSVDSIQGAVRFLPAAAGVDGSVGPCCISATMDEVLAHVSFATNCGGFTASIMVEPMYDEITGARIPVPCEETLRYEGFLEHSASTRTGGTKSQVRGTLISADRSTVYARASGLFVRPASEPTPRQTDALFAETANMALSKAEEDAEALAAAERRRARALDSLRVTPGSPLLVTHLQEFEVQRERWLDAEAATALTRRDLGALELHGKVFAVLPVNTSGSVRGAVKFTYCSQGLPSIVFGGSIFAVLERAAFVACQDLRPRHEVRLLRTELQMKARLPVNETARLELTVESSAAGTQGEEFRVIGRLLSMDGNTVFDVVEALLVAVPQATMPIGLSSKL